MDISLESNFKEFSKYLRDSQKVHLPSIYRNTLNELAKQAMVDLKANLPIQVKNPTDYTLKGIQYKEGDKRNLQSQVGFVSQTFGKKRRGAVILPAEYMSRLNTGGVRIPQKKVIAVPVLKNYKPYKFRNIKRNDISKFLSDDNKYFVGPPRGAKKPGGYGIFKRMGRGGRKNIAMLITFNNDTDYRKTYNFGQPIRRTVRTKLKKIFARYFREVLTKKGAMTRFTTM